MIRPGQSLLHKLSPSQTEKLPADGKLTLAARTIERLLKQLSAGYLVMTFPNGEQREFGARSDSLHAEIRFHRWSAFQDILRHGDIGFAEGYIRGDWDSPHLEKLLDLAVKNRNILERAIYGNWFGSLVYRFRHFLNRNNKTGSKKKYSCALRLGKCFLSLMA